MNTLDPDDWNTLVEAITGAALAEAIKHNTTIRQLNLSVNNRDTDDCKTLVEAIKHHSTITQLDLSVTKLGSMPAKQWWKQSNTIQQ